MRKRPSREQARLLHELRVHLRLGPHPGEAVRPFEVHMRLHEQQREGRTPDLDFHNRIKAIGVRCLEAGIPKEAIVRIILQKSKC